MSQEKIKILIISDSKSDLLVYREYLAEENIDLFEAMSYEQAKAMFLARVPDVIIVEYKVNGINGLKVIDKLRQLSSKRKISSIVITTSKIKEVKETSDIKLTNDYLYKETLTKETLLTSINSIYSNSKEDKLAIKNKNKLESALLKAKALVEENNQFLAGVAHELRTPLNGVIGFLGLLKEEDVEKEKKDEYISLANVAALHLLNLVNDLLDFSKIEAKKLDLELVKLDLSDVINNSCSICTTQMEAKDIVLAIDISDDILDSYYGDPSRLQQIFINLISNAIKFTPVAGAILVNVVKNNENSDETQDQIIFSISDTGIGIPKDKTDKIFSPFSQVNRSTSREYGGTGLGLSIVTKLINLMNGDIWVESIEGVGSCFKFSLNLDKFKKSKVRKQISKENKVATSGKRILLAEDNEINQRLFRIVLEKMGHVVSIVDNGEEALDFAKNNEIDIIFMDIQMPKMNGLVASSEIRKIEKNSDNQRLPIVALTANAIEYEDSSYKEAGIDFVLGKPFDKEKVKAAIKKYCG